MKKKVRHLKVVSGGEFTRLAEDVGDDLYIKDSLLAFRGTDTALRNHAIAWVLSRRLSRRWLEEPPYQWRWVALSYFALARLFRPKDSEEKQREFAAAILNVLPYARRFTKSCALERSLWFMFRPSRKADWKTKSVIGILMCLRIR